MITGATGFVGRHLVQALSPDHRVFQLNRRGTGSQREIVHDLAKQLPLGQLPKHLDAVIHSGGVVGVAEVSSRLYDRVNVGATRELAEYAILSGAKQFIFCSTGGVYQPSELCLSEQSPVSPSDLYSASKLAAELALQDFSNSIEVKVLRLFFPFGPTQKARFVPTLIRRILNSEPIELRSPSGQPLLNPLYISDLVEFVSRVLKLQHSFVANVAGNDAASVRIIAQIIGARLHRDVTFKIANSGPAHNWWSSIELISALTEFVPEISLEQGLQWTVDEYTGHA